MNTVTDPCARRVAGQPQAPGAWKQGELLGSSGSIGADHLEADNALSVGETPGPYAGSQSTGLAPSKSELRASLGPESQMAITTRSNVADSFG